jgi:hypothetical protein
MRPIVSALFLLAAFACAPLHAGPELTREALEAMADHYRFFKMLPDSDEGRVRYLYADEGPHLHVYEVNPKGWSSVAWETIVGSTVRGLEVVTTVEGNHLFVVATARGNVFAYDADTYELVRENLLEPFSSIQAMTIGQLDTDEPQEVVLLGVREGDDKPLLYVYDGRSRALEWNTQDSYKASEILVANLDDDVQQEIILNTGVIFDSRFRTVEIEYAEEGGFGTRLRLLDTSGDGIPEIFGITIDDLIRVYDPAASRRLW